jgi:hypothetical protein
VLSIQIGKHADRYNSPMRQREKRLYSKRRARALVLTRDLVRGGETSIQEKVTGKARYARRLVAQSC